MTPAGTDPAADAWGGLRRFTAARIALGRSGGSQRTASVLDFRLSHARARDAVQAVFDPVALAQALAPTGLEVLTLASAVGARQSYLLRPDLGRVLAPASQAVLAERAGSPGQAGPDLVLVISDGLAAAAAQRHAAATVMPLVASLLTAGWRLGPICLVPFARVKLQDAIGACLRARYTLMFLGERPGLGAPDSLGAYLTADPAPERTDADRNCVSNIRPEGLPPAEAARKLLWLLETARATGRSGLSLKDEAPEGALSCKSL